VTDRQGSTGRPVLLIAFNRPELTAAVVARIAETTPSRIYVAVDGPRPGFQDDRGRVDAVREAIRPLELVAPTSIRMSDVNLGCGRGPAEAISWFFKCEESGIVLEDDILATPEFFSFANLMLERYRGDRRVWSISGSSLVPSHICDPESTYRFSVFPGSWGWATWRDRWNRFRFGPSEWLRSMPLNYMRRTQGVTASLFWEYRTVRLAMAARRGTPSVWDYQWVLTHFANQGLAVVPNLNQVKNLALVRDATHPSRSALVDPVAVPLQLDRLEHPGDVRPSANADQWMLDNVYRASMRGALRRVSEVG
jgi:hypothetical protein